MLKSLTKDEFEQVITGDTPVLIDFYADWCGPCKRIEPVLQEIAAENEGKFLVCKINVDENQDVAREYQVMNIPHMISFKNGQVHKRAVGAIPKDEILELLA